MSPPTSSARSTSIEAARDAQAVKRLVNFQTALCYGRPETCRSRSIIRCGRSPATAFPRPPASSTWRVSDLPFVSLRLANVTGPRLAIGPIPTFYKRLKAGQELLLHRARCAISSTCRIF